MGGLATVGIEPRVSSIEGGVELAMAFLAFGLFHECIFINRIKRRSSLLRRSHTAHKTELGTHWVECACSFYM